MTEAKEGIEGQYFFTEIPTAKKRQGNLICRHSLKLKFILINRHPPKGCTPGALDLRDLNGKPLAGLKPISRELFKVMDMNGKETGFVFELTDLDLCLAELKEET